MRPSTSLFLASKSPRRQQILKQIGVDFEVISVDVEELRSDDESPESYVQRLAADKSAAGLRRLTARDSAKAQRSTSVVLGADTIVVCDGEILEKPADEREAINMLQKLSGKAHHVLTAICLCSQEEQKTQLAETQVDFRPLSDEECRAYCKTGEPFDKAGAYAIQGAGAVFVERIDGSYSGVVGLPIEILCPLLSAFNVPWWQGRDKK